MIVPQELHDLSVYVLVHGKSACGMFVLQYLVKFPMGKITQTALQLLYACIFSFFAGSQKKFAVSPTWSKLARFA